MPVLIIRDEGTLVDLRPRLVGRRGPSEIPERLAAALRDANPNVDFDDLRPGTVVTVPDVEDARVRDDAMSSELVFDGIDALIAAVGGVLASAGQQAAQQAKVEAADRAIVRRSLGLKAVADAVERDQDLRAEVARVEETLAAADEDAEQAARAREQALATWTDDLAAIKALRG